MTPEELEDSWNFEQAEKDFQKRITKKYYLSTLQVHDREKDDSVVRIIEMAVDSSVPEIGYSIQFWTDVRLYGVAEAILYLKNVISPEKFAELNVLWEAQLKKIQS